MLLKLQLIVVVVLLLLLLLLLPQVTSLITKTRNKLINTISLDNNERILWIGGTKVVLGSSNDYGFINIIINELSTHSMYSNITIINGGLINSNIETYNERYDDLILYHKPTTVVIMFGDDELLLLIKHIKSSSSDSTEP